MRVLLVNSPIDSVLAHGHVSPVTAHLFYNSAPLGLLYLAAVLEQRGEIVVVVDAPAEGLDVAATVRRAEECRPDLIGIGSTTVVFEGACALARALKRALPGVPIVLGGWHVTVQTRAAMSHDCFDVGVVGEGEHTLAELVDHFQGTRTMESIAGLVFREAGELRYTAPRPPVSDLDALPLPARHLVPPGLYRPVPVDDHGTPKLSMISSRGCPHSCVFCQKAGSGYRSHSPARIAAEMAHLVAEHGARDIAFVDSLFCASKRRVTSVCEAILDQGIGVSWTCSSRVEVVDEPLLGLMRDAGCWRTRFGVESGSDRVLQTVSKGITKDRVRRAVGAADRVGLRPKAFFILGHLADTRDTIEESIAFAKELPLHDVTVQLNTILPGTRQMEIWEREGERWGRLVSTRTDETSFWEPTFVPWGLEPEELARLQRRFYREFYLRPVTISRHLRHLRSTRDVAKYLRGLGLAGFLFLERPGRLTGSS